MVGGGEMAAEEALYLTPDTLTVYYNGVQEVAVVGGGDTATEEALYLTKYASHVHLLVRGQRLRASAAMQDRVRAHDKVTLHQNTQARPTCCSVMQAHARTRCSRTLGGELV